MPSGNTARGAGVILFSVDVELCAAAGGSFLDIHVSILLVGA